MNLTTTLQSDDDRRIGNSREVTLNRGRTDSKLTAGRFRLPHRDKAVPHLTLT
jgi:hypothetical protein